MGDVQHNCGLAVAHTLHDAYSLISSLQHRGRDATGIAAIGDTIDVIKWRGGVKTFDLQDLHKILDSSLYHSFVAHLRYATRGQKDRVLEDAHPHVIGGTIDDRGDHVFISDCLAIIAHNGQQNSLERLLNERSDTQALLNFYDDRSAHSIIREIPGSYTVAVAHKRKKHVAVFRDPLGMKPGVLGQKDGKYVFASEDTALRKNGAEVIEDLLPGAIYYLHPEGSFEKDQFLKPSETPKNLQRCFFEWNYIAHVESNIGGISAQRVRRVLGEQLAKEHTPDDIDIVSFLPRCPEHAARGYAEVRNLPFKPLFYKKRNERSFQGPNEKERSQSIKNNLGILPYSTSTLNESLEGKTIYLIDDSTIRGNASKHALELLYNAGVKKVYLANYTPKIGVIGDDGTLHGCEYGVDMPPTDNFVVREGSRNRTDEEINEAIGAEVYFMSKAGMFKAFKRAGVPQKSICTFCIGGPRPF